MPSQKPTIAAEKVADYILDHLGEPIVISGFRAPAEIEFLENEMKLRGKTFVTRFVSAAEAIRFKRLSSRARPGDNITIEEFRARDRQQQRMGLDAISQSPDVWFNAGIYDSLEAYLQQIDILAEEGGRSNEIEIDLEGRPCHRRGDI